MDEDIVRDHLMKALDEEEWDMSDNSLGRVAGKLSHYFKSDTQSREFVDENASYLFSLLESQMEDDSY
jgi:hypothetical protein